jgi:hypothetical protein
MISLSEIFSVLSDDDSLRIIQMIVDHRDPKTTDFESPKRYYTRLSKLKNALIVRRKGRSYELTAFGSVIYDIIQTVKLAHELHWKLQVIDAIGDRVPDTERQQIIESLIPDRSIRKTLIETRLANLEEPINVE